MPSSAQHRIFLITPNALKYANTSATGVFTSLADFSKAVNCTLPGDQILIEGGQVLQGRIKLTDCSGDYSDSGGVVIRSFHPEHPLDENHAAPNALIRAAPSASDLNLPLMIESKPSFRGKLISHLSGRTLYKIGPFKYRVNQVFNNDERLSLAHFPKEASAANRTRYAPLLEARDKGNDCLNQICLKFSDEETRHALEKLLAIEGNSIADAYVVVRSSPWTLARANIGTVTNKAEIQLTESIYGTGHATSVMPSAGHGVIFFNSFAFLNDAGEWYFNAEDNCVYILWDNKDTKPLASHLRFSIDMDREQDKVQFNNAGLSFVIPPLSGGAPGKIQLLKIQGISIYQPAGSGIRVSGVKNVEIKGTEVISPVGNGIEIKNIPNRSKILNNRIIGAGAIAISATATPTIEIVNNTVDHAGYIGTQAQMEMAFSGINLNPGFIDATISANLIRNVGYAGIVVSEPTQDMMDKFSAIKLEISHNEISRFCLLLNDCGGIYINGQNKRVDNISRSDSQKKSIINNRFFDPIPNMDGTPHQTGILPTIKKPLGDWEEMVTAVYLDRKASNYEVRSNHIAGQYKPYTWMIRGGGLYNVCGSDSVDKCNLSRRSKSTPNLYQCYTQELDKCNMLSR